MNTTNIMTALNTLRALAVVVVCFATLPAVCQSQPKYQVGTITAVERGRDGDKISSDDPIYDVSIQVNRTIYVVRYKPPYGLNTVQYAAGREVVVLVGEKTITYNDMLGDSRELPIITQKPAMPLRADK